MINQSATSTPSHSDRDKMNVHMHREIDAIKMQILEMGRLAEDLLEKSLLALVSRDAVLAEEVIQNDHEIDMMELRIEEECLKILALHQPVAVDLRFMVAVLKINNDLERIADLAVNIADRAKDLQHFPNEEIPVEISTMKTKSQAMLRDVITSLMELNEPLARDIFERDDAIDAMHRQMYQQMSAKIQATPEKTDYYISILSVSRYLERVSDQATNIAEDVVYLITGDIVRHGIKRIRN